MGKASKKRSIPAESADGEKLYPGDRYFRATYTSCGWEIREHVAQVVAFQEGAYIYAPQRSFAVRNNCVRFVIDALDRKIARDTAEREKWISEIGAINTKKEANHG